MTQDDNQRSSLTKALAKIDLYLEAFQEVEENITIIAGSEAHKNIIEILTDCKQRLEGYGELLPCPLCNGKADCDKSVTRKGVVQYITCEDCYLNIEGTVEQWNTRPTHQLIKKLCKEVDDG